MRAIKKAGEAVSKSNRKFQLNSLTDEELVNLYKRGETHAFRVLYERYRIPLFNFIFRLVIDREKVEELFQEVFMRVVKSIDSYVPKAKFKTWLYTIARNLCIDLYRSRASAPTLYFSQPIVAGGDEKSALENFIPNKKARDPENEAFSGQFKVLLNEAIKVLPPEQKEVFLLRSLELQYNEIAEIVGAPENTVKSRMRYALLGIRKYFREKGVTEEILRK